MFSDHRLAIRCGVPLILRSNNVFQNGAMADLEPEQFRKMFIGGLTSTTTDETLREFYSKWGELVDCVVMRDPTTKRSRGFGFVSYSKQSEVRYEVKKCLGRWPGRLLLWQSPCLYVYSIRKERKLQCEIIADKATGKPRGFAFVTFDDYDAVDKCILIKSHMINNARCDVKKAL
uniref:RRM domain-containing protein n=1 Tax=Parascaris equorum TaxID=6256 RepID=A0A914RCB3_PAREQ